MNILKWIEYLFLSIIFFIMFIISIIIKPLAYLIHFICNEVLLIEQRRLFIAKNYLNMNLTKKEEELLKGDEDAENE